MYVCLQDNYGRSITSYIMRAEVYSWGANLFGLNILQLNTPKLSLIHPWLPMNRNEHIWKTSLRWGVRLSLSAPKCTIHLYAAARWDSRPLTGEKNICHISSFWYFTLRLKKGEHQQLKTVCTFNSSPPPSSNNFNEIWRGEGGLSKYFHDIAFRLTFVLYTLNLVYKLIWNVQECDRAAAWILYIMLRREWTRSWRNEQRRTTRGVMRLKVTSRRGTGEGGIDHTQK